MCAGAHRVSAVLAGAILAVLAAAAARAGDWPQYKRDSARTGDAPGEALKFPMRRVVAVRLPAPIYASPAVAGGKVYVQDARGNVVCVDAAANKVLWLTQIGGVSNMSSPAVAGGRVYVGSSAGHLAILDAADGRGLAKVPGPGGVIASPAVTESGIYFSTLNGKLVKIDPAGKVIWTFDQPTSSHLEFAVRGNEIMFVATRAGEKIYRDFSGMYYRLLDEGDSVRVLGKGVSNIYPSGGPVFGPGGRCGFEFWSAEYGGFLTYCWQDDPNGKFAQLSQMGFMDSRITPSLRGGRYVLGTNNALACAQAETLKVVWRTPVASDGFHSSPALAADYAAAGCDDGVVRFYPLAPEAGAVRKEAWSYATGRAGKVSGAVSSSPAVADGRVFFGGEDGVLYGLGQGPEAGVVEAAAKTAAPERPGKALIGPEWHTAGGDMGFSAVSPDTHLKPPLRIRWRTRVWGSFKGCMIVAGGRVFAASRSGTLTALDADTGEILWRTRHPGIDSWATATYVDGRLLVLRAGRPEGRGLWCHDAATGEVLWRKPEPTATGQYDFSAGAVAHNGLAMACWYEGGDVLAAAAYKLATGEPVWQKRYEGVGVGEAGASAAHVSQGAIGEGVWFCSASNDRGGRGRAKDWRGKGATLAIDPATGRLIWKTNDYFVAVAGRVAYRKGVVVVFESTTAHALDGRTGKHLWTGRSGSTQTNALTDVYLDSKGTRGVGGGSYCAYHAHANGVWYGTESWSGSRMIAYTLGERNEKKVLWEHRTLSRSCPAPAPAYGRLYYAPNCEGVVYCFENAE